MAIVHGCDYLQVEDHFFTVYGTQEPENSIRAILNFYPAEEAGQNGRRESYQKHVNDVDAGYALQRCDFVEEDDIFHGLQVVPDNQVERVYSTTDGLNEGLESIDSPIYREYVEELQDIGVPLDDIGLGGSRLIGLSYEDSDYDLVVRGMENMEMVKDNFGYLKDVLEMGPVPEEKREEKVEYYSQRHDISDEKIQRIVANKWVKHLLPNDQSSTIKFTYKEGEQPSSAPEPSDDEITVSGEVVENRRSHFLPRQYTVETARQEYEIWTYYWMFTHAADLGETVEAKGTVCGDGETLLLNRSDHYIAPAGTADSHRG